MNETPYKYPHSKVSLPIVSSKPAPAGPAAMPTTPSPATQPTSAAPSATAPPANPVSSIHKKLLEGKVIEVLHTIYDPEIPVNIYELGLIYEIKISDDNNVLIKMTLTAPGCPVAGDIVAQVHRKIISIPEVNDAEVQLVWDPPWTKDHMSEAAMLELGL